MMTSVRLQGVQLTGFECDTAASHSVISDKVFSKLQKKLTEKLCVKKVNIAIRLADGSSSNKSSGVVQIKVNKADNEPVLLSFFVISGPNCLLGCHALEQLWPAEYRALRAATKVSKVSNSSTQLSSPQQVSVKNVESVNPGGGQYCRLPMAPNDAVTSSETHFCNPGMGTLPPKLILDSKIADRSLLIYEFSRF